MKNKSIVYEISLSGILSAIGIMVGLFAFSPIGIGKIYLVGIIIFLMPLILRLQFALLSGMIILVFTDLYTGYIVTTWISMIAYLVGIITIFLFTLSKKKWFFIIGLIIGSLLTTTIYFFLEYFKFDMAYAIADLWTTLIQFAIVIPITTLLYVPILLITNKI